MSAGAPGTHEVGGSGGTVLGVGQVRKRVATPCLRGRHDVQGSEFERSDRRISVRGRAEGMTRMLEFGGFALHCCFEIER